MKKRVLRSILALFLIYSIWLGYQILTFGTHTAERPPIPGNTIQGAYHIHTTLSDGRRAPDEVIEIARNQSLDFIILTDHGNPNFLSIEEEGWKDGLLVLAGAEISTSRGHLVGLGFDVDDERFSQKAEEAASQVARNRGFTIIAHPYSRGGWSWGDVFVYSGIELMNANTMVRKNILLSLPYLPAILVKPDYALVRMLDDPEKNMRKWDSLTRDHAVYAYFSPDAHLLYGPLFRLFRLHLSLEESLPRDFEGARRMVYEAMRRGRFYNAVNAAAHASGFQFYGMREGERISMGETIGYTPPLSLHVRTPAEFAREIRLIRNGSLILETGKRDLSYEVPAPGVYRAEVYLRERTHLGKDIPWIVSNPIFIRE